MHDPVALSGVLLARFRVDVVQRVVHPRLVPSRPVRRGGPQVPVRPELLHHLRQSAVLLVGGEICYINYF